MKILTLLLFLVSLGTCLYVYFGYPLLLWLVSRIRSRPVRRRPITPPVTLVIAAFNEEAIIAAKLENSLALDYPSEELEIVVVSDGSTDSTDEIVRGFAHAGVHLVSRPREGKLRALSAGVDRAGGDIVILTDASDPRGYQFAPEEPPS